jgi:Leucine Rich Repeat (LRR) protein
MPAELQRSERRMALARWLKFSVRSLMLIVLVVAVLLAWQVNRARQQRRAVDAIKAYGGFVSYDWQYVNGTFTSGRSPWAPIWLRRAIGDEFFQEVVGVNLIVGTAPDGRRVETKRLTDDVIVNLTAFPKLKDLTIQKTQATDRALETIGTLTDLEILRMSDAHVTDAGVGKLRNLRNLKYLDITNSGLTDESLRHIAGLSRLEILNLQNNNRFSDKGLAYIQGMTNLKGLLLSNLVKGIDITDDGLLYLRNMKNLEMLAIQSSKVTDRGIMRLKQHDKLSELWVLGRDRRALTKDGVSKLKQEMPSLISVR